MNIKNALLKRPIPLFIVVITTTKIEAMISLTKVRLSLPWYANENKLFRQQSVIVIDDYK